MVGERTLSTLRRESDKHPTLILILAALLVAALLDAFVAAI